MVDSVLRAAVLGLVIRALRRDAPHMLPRRRQQRGQAHVHAEAVWITCARGHRHFFMHGRSDVESCWEGTQGIAVQASCDGRAGQSQQRL